MTNPDQLRDYPLFDGLDEHELSSLATCISKRTFARGAYLYYPGSPALNVYLVESGMIGVYFSAPAGQEFLLDLVVPHSVVGLLLRENQARIGAAAALQTSIVLVLSQKDLGHFTQRYPRLMHNIQGVVDESFRRLAMYALSLATISLQGRVAAALLQLTRDTGRGVQNELDLPLSQTEFATLVGASRAP